MNLGTLIYTSLKGRLVGRDADGNRYFTERSPRASARTRRWVLYAKQAEATAVPPEWHAWLHYTTDAPLSEAGRKSWQKPHKANATGTAQAYLPPGHDTRGGQRAAATGDYEAWTPGS